MSNLQNSYSDGNMDNRPSTSNYSAPQTSTSITSQNSVEENKASNKICVESQTTLKTENEDYIPTITFTNSAIQDLTKQYQNVNLVSDGLTDADNACANMHKEDANPVSKKKNARKKEKYKNLQIQMPPLNTTNPPQNIMPTPILNSSTSVQQFFLNQITPLYATTSSRYLENLTHHPQYQLMQSMQFREIFQNQVPLSVPNSPFIQHNNHSNSMSFPGTPESPKYLQNVMQHPLLNQSYAGSHHNASHHPLLNSNLQFNRAQENSPKIGTPKSRKKNDDRQTNHDKKFDPYMSAEEVESGLKSNTLLEGVLRINPKQFQHAYISSNDRSEQDVFIDGVKNRNRALEGDVVVVQFIEGIIDEPQNSNNDSKQKLGRVVFIKEKVHNRTCIGILKLLPDKNRQKALFVPRDYRIPRLNIPFTCWPDNFYENSEGYENTLFLAKIINWSDTRFASGKILCNIGESGDMKTETQAILAQTDLDITPFGPEVRHLYPRLDYIIPAEEFKLREDCRNLCLFSIDPFNCRDIDDAMSCKKLKNGNYEIGVHISDVAHFLTEDTPLDEKVADKATTIYMVERAYHMLPDDLCMLCSLFPGVDKLAFSVFWEITDDAEVLSHRFAKTVIHSCCQLAYEHAQAVLEDKEDARHSFPEIYKNFQFKDVYESIKILGKISSAFRKRRFEGGALRIDQPKVSFKLSPVNGLPESFWIYQSQESHQMIEEFMLLANMTVAKRIHDDHPKLAFLRCHPPPSGYMLKQLAKSLKPMGIDIDITSAGDLHKSLLQHVGTDCDRGKAMVLNMLCAKPMARAKYFCAGGSDDEDFHHYALNVPLYTHFTSPIRRYADIMVHRLLAASLKYRENPKWEIDKVRMVAAQCNKQKYNAKKAGELSSELYTLKYIENNSPLVCEAVVVDVKEKYIDVIIVSMGLNRRIYFNNDFPGKYIYLKNEAGFKLSKMELLWKATENSQPKQQVIEVFSILEVAMHKGDDMVKVETKLVQPQ